MADFTQSGPIATLHRLDTSNLRAIEGELESFASRRPIALVLPCLFSEFTRPAIGHIIEELRHVRYLDHVVVSLGKATFEDLAVAKAAFAVLPQRVSFVWNDGPAVQALYALLARHGLAVPHDGKGRSCWIANGCVLADGKAGVIATHDCDITTYSRELLARLCYPVAHPELGFDFATGYYARVGGGTLNGRVTRLFVTPLLGSLGQILGTLPLLSYLASFRYVLAGEFAMRANLARVNRVPCNWGLEVGVLAEVYRNCGPRRICQTELCTTYDHKHQPVSAEDPSKGLLRMCIDISEVLLATLAGEGVVFGNGLLKTVVADYMRTAQDMIDRYAADAAINRLRFDRHAEEQMVSVFARGLSLACNRYTMGQIAVPGVPSWNRVVAAIPDFFDLLSDAVLEDTFAAAAA